MNNANQRIARFEQAAAAEKLHSPDVIQQGSISRSSSVSLKIFEVQSAAGKDGVYNCYEQTLDATAWPDTSGADKFDDKDAVSVEVLNLEENDPVADYTPALVLYDRLACWRTKDDEGNSRWVGVPLVSGPRRVRAAESAPAATNITCNVILNNEAEATSGQLGYHIEVYADICGNGGNLNNAATRIKVDQYLWAVNRQGKWYFSYNYNSSVECS